MESKITKELKRIAEKNAGRLFPRDVVEEARPATSPLHNSFEWDDGKAAEAWRIEQARHLIQVSVTVLPGASAPVRAFISLTTDRKDAGGYLPVEAVVSSIDLREIMLKDAAAELQIFVAKFKGVQELVDVTESAKKFLRSRQPSVSDAGL
jgi:hypothetical protein